MLLVSITSANAGVQFSAPSAFGTGNSPHSVAIADLDMDGRLDLAVANIGGGFGTQVGPVSVLLGNGDGTFRTRTDFLAGIDPASVAIADLNADGKPDLAVANAGIYHSGHTSTISVLLGNGDGTFRPKRDFDAGNYPLSLTIADLNGDGHPDLTVGNGYASTVSVLLGNGDGTFRGRTAFATRDYPTSLAIADLNADGKLDLAVANLGNPYVDRSTVSVLLGNGDGTFRTRSDFVSAGGPRSLAIADLNADGAPDLAMVSNWIGDVIRTVSILPGNGDGTFRARTDFDTADYPQVMAIADLDADGRLDLAIATWRTVSVLQGNGDGTFGASADFGVATETKSSMAIADLDADGRHDIVMTGLASNSVSVLLNQTPPAPLAMGFDFTPETLSPASRGRWVTGFLEPAPPLAAKEIEIPTIRLNESVPVDAAAPAAVGDHDEDGIPDLMVKFDRALVVATLAAGDSVPVTVTGTVNGQSFSGIDYVRVGASKTPVPVPGRTPRPELTVRAAGPAVDGRVPVEFALPNESPARLELMDVAGRTLASREVGAMGPGHHAVDLASGRSVPPGVYFVRLTQASTRAHARIAVLR